jgi:hypothetical protein
MRDLVTKEIDGSIYQFQQFNTTTALKIMAKLTKLIGEPLIIAFGALKADKTAAPGAGKRNLLDRDIDTAVLAQAARALVDRLDEDEVIAVVKRLTGENIICDNKNINFDVHYAARFGHLFKVLQAALEVQYGNFFSAVAGQAGMTAAQVGMTRV